MIPTQLEVNGIDVHYGHAQALFDVSLVLGEKEIVSVIGPNGAGKTTLLKAILGLLKASKGDIRLGTTIKELPAYERAKLGIALVPEGRGLFSHLTVRENLEIGAYFVKDKNELKNRLETVYRLFPILSDRSTQRAGTLSGGEQQMLAIGRAIMMQPKILLLDEPSIGLSPLMVSNVFKTIKLLTEHNLSVLLVEQNLFAALSVADRGYVLENGRIVMSGSSAELSANTDVKHSYLGLERTQDRK